jgi:O-antigen ligase
MPVAAYFLGRALTLSHLDRRRVGWAILGVGAVVAAWGLLDIYTVSLQTWRDSGVPGWYREQLGLDYGKGLSGLPENFVYNPGDERPLRRLVSTFLSPLATAYMLLAALLLAATWGRTRWLPAVTALLAVGLLFTYSRTTIAALAVGLVALAYGLRQWWPVVAAAIFVAAAFFFVRGYEDLAPEARFTAAELQVQRAGGANDPTSGDPLGRGESSVDSHLDSLREGIKTVARHPWGYGLGNAGVTAKRTETVIKAGESTYTELGVDIGLLGMLAFAAWNIALALTVLRRAPWLGATFVAVLLLAVQTDVIGVHWLAFVLWALAGERA